MEVMKNIYVKGEGDHNMVSRWFKKFCLCCKNRDDQSRSGRSKTMDSEAVFQAIEVNLVSSI